MTPQDTKKTHVSDAKKKIVTDLKDLLTTKKTILISSIKNLPAAQFQQISKKLRGKALVKVPKKSLITRAIDATENKELEKLKEIIDADTAIMFSDLDSFELAGELLKNKSPAKAKTGQEAPEDIKIDAGPTELIPGPAISELGAVGLQVEVKDGKISIRESKVIVKQGEAIKQAAADIMSKLDIKPFSIGFVPLGAFDTQEKKFYAEINIDPEGTLNDLKSSHEKALAFAVERGYTSPDTIKFILGKAHSHGKALDALQPAGVPSAEGEETAKEDNEPTPTDKTEGEDK